MSSSRILLLQNIIYFYKQRSKKYDIFNYNYFPIESFQIPLNRFDLIDKAMINIFFDYQNIVTNYYYISCTRNIVRMKFNKKAN